MQLSQIIKVTRKLFLTAFTLFLAVAVSVFIRLAHSPVVFDDNLEKIHSWLDFSSHQVTLESLSLHFDSGFHFVVKGLEIHDKVYDENLRVEHVSAKLSNRNLVLGRLVPKHLEVQGVDLNIEFSRQNVHIIGLNFDTEKKAEATLVQFLNRKDIPVHFRDLKTLRLKDANIFFSDFDRNRKWYMEEVEAEMSKHFRHGEQIQMFGLIRQGAEEQFVPANIEVAHAPLANHVDIAVVFKNSDTKMLYDYLPIRNHVDLKGDVRFKAELDAQNQIQNPRFGFRVGEGSVHIEKAYNKPFMFNWADFEGHYSSDNSETLVIDHLEFEDAQGALFNVKGSASELLTNPKMDIHLTLQNEAPVLHIASYLPDLLMKNTTGWINKSVHKGVASNLKLSYTGRPKELPLCGDKCGFDGEFDFKDLTLNFLSDVEPGTHLSGHFDMDEDYIKITSKKGHIGQQVARDIMVRIYNHFSPEAENRISISGRLTGKVQEVVTTLEKKFGHKEEASGHIDGDHISQVYIDLPLKDPHLGNIDLNISSDLSELYTNSKAYVDGAQISVPLATIKVTERDLLLAGRGLVNGSQGNLSWREDMGNIFKNTKIGFMGKIAESKLSPILSPYGVDIENSSYMNLQLTKHGEEKWLYKLNANFENSKLKVPALNFVKEEGESFNLYSEGLFSKDFEQITSTNLKASGGENLIEGVFNYNANSKQPLNFSFKEFNLGRTKAVASLKHNKFQVSGKSLDLSGATVAQRKGGMEKFTKGEVDISANTAYFSGGELNAFEFALKREDNKWIDGSFKALAGEFPVEGNLYTEETGRHVVDFFAKNAGLTLGILGLFPDLRDGEMIGNFSYIEDEKGEPQGGGHVSIVQTSLVKAPVLAKLLSLISLEEIFSSKKGILFHEVSVPFSIIGQGLKFKKVEMKGPSIGLNFRGEYSLRENYITAKGQLIPVSGLNKVVGKIPLVGRLLTGSQKGLLVADFKIKGPAKNPDVSVNPLSIVTPGILKDAFGALTGD